MPTPGRRGCVREVHEGRPLSFMTRAAAELLAELGRRGVFVPDDHPHARAVPRVTAARPAAALRDRAPTAGILLVDGAPDPDWHARGRARLADECAPLARCGTTSAGLPTRSGLRKLRIAEDLFCYAVVRAGAAARGVRDGARGLGRRARLDGVVAGPQALLRCPKPLTKSAAVAEVARRTGAELVLAAGDSLLDADLLLAADRGWRPGHGELADAGWTAPEITALPERGVLAGERILREFLKASRLG